MGLTVRPLIYGAATVALIVSGSLAALSTLTIRELVLCAATDEVLMIPRPLCRTYLDHFTTQQEADELDAGPGLAFSFAIPDANDREAVIKRLLSIGVDIDRSAPIDGLTPLNAAVLANDARLVAYLIENGAKLDNPDQAHQQNAQQFAERLQQQNPAVDRSEVTALLKSADQRALGHHAASAKTEQHYQTLRSNRSS